MQLLDLSLTSPAENLACDEALLDLCEEQTTEVLRFWESPRPFVVVGYGNRTATEVNMDECFRRGVPVLRRCSGGGTVVQGPGCLNYNLALRIDRREELTTVTSTNEFVMQRHCAALQRLCPFPLAVQGHTDLAFHSGSWLKFSGNAQRRRRNALVFHGTILHSFDLALIELLLRFPSAQPDYRANRAHTEFVRNFPSTDTQIREAISHEWGAARPLDSLPQQRIEQLRRQQYDNASWNLRR